MIKSGSDRIPWRLLTLLVLGAALWLVYSIRGILAPFLWAAILAYLMNPVVQFFEERGIRRNAAVGAIYFFVVGALGLSIYCLLRVVWEDIPDLQYKLPTYVKMFQKSMMNARYFVEEAFPWLRSQHVLDKTIQAIADWSKNFVGRAPSYVTSFFEICVYFVLVPFVAFYFLTGTPRLLQASLHRIPGRWVEKFLGLLYKVDEVIGNYIRGVIVEAAFVGLISGVGLSIMKVPYAALIGVASGLGNMIPYFGPILGGALGVSVAFFQFHTLNMPTKVAVLFTCVHFVDSYILQPLIMKRSVNLSPVAVLFALMVGWELGNVWGLVFAVPVASLIKETFLILSEWFLAERGLLTPSQDATLLAAKPWTV